MAGAMNKPGHVRSIKNDHPQRMIPQHRAAGRAWEAQATLWKLIPFLKRPLAVAEGLTFIGPLPARLHTTRSRLILGQPLGPDVMQNQCVLEAGA